MRLGRLRRGELLVAAGLIGLVVSLFLNWYGAAEYADSSPSSSLAVAVQVDPGWGALGHPWLELLALFGLALVVVLVTAVRARPGRPTYGAVVALVVSIALGGVVLLTTALRALLLRPGVDLGDRTLHVAPAVGGYVGVASVLVALAGLWVAMADDRTAAPESAYDPPAPRPVPPLRPDEPDAPPPAE